MPGSRRGGPASSAPGVVDGGRECRITVDSSVLAQLRRGRLELVEARLTQSKPQVGLSSLEPQVGRPQPRAEQRRGGRELQTAARELLEEGPAGGGSSPLLLEAPPPLLLEVRPPLLLELSRTAGGGAGSPSTSSARAQLRRRTGTELRHWTWPSGSWSWM
jgi:hypothetical protein